MFSDFCFGLFFAMFCMTLTFVSVAHKNYICPHFLDIVKIIRRLNNRFQSLRLGGKPAFIFLLFI